MTTLKRVEQMCDNAMKMLNISKEKLDRLEELRKGTAQPMWNGEQVNLESKEESLETEKKIWFDQLAMLQAKLMEYTQSGKRKLDLDDGNEGGDRKKVPELTSAQIIMKRIMELPEDPDVYSNPKNSLSLPFPFLGSKKPVERFAFNDDEFSFTFMGRREFKNVLDEINKLRATYYMEMFIYGTMGYGKSYILSAITCYLFRVKKRVVYLPDCRALSLDPVDYIKSALFLTYVNDLEEINRISLCETLGDIVDFFKSVDERLYFIIDQLNALDGNDTGITPQTKIEIREIINKIRNKHFCIKSASANNERARQYKKQTDEIKMALYGGLKEDEMLEWWVRHGHLLDHDERENQMKEIEDITGCVPLFLRYFLESYNDNSDETFDFRKNHLIENLESKIKPNLDQFSLNKFVIEYDQNRYV
ncbi:10899_t:CDS:2 [Funneliformis mosseae]|uniref:10899_t:CDS:1 n=1 Tax=Funneliformis mosseae TaxID=27381 RepID=A0A9N9CQ94_FUNMO|nr:10899_t:CDS:2 [Funneliformis mosseae]